jgi:hypothetical protein
MIIDVFVDRFETDDFTKPQYFLIEPHSYFIETHPVVMASCLVDIRNEVTNKIRLMNPFDYEIGFRLSNLDAGNLSFIQQYNSFSQFYISGPSFTFHKNI